MGNVLKVLDFGVDEGKSGQAFGVAGLVSAAVVVVVVVVVAGRDVLGLGGDFLFAFLIDVARVGDLRISGDGDSGENLLWLFLGEDKMLPRPEVGEMGDVIPWGYRVRGPGA